jgi:NADH-quinone oxidoreductase subunit N
MIPSYDLLARALGPEIALVVGALSVLAADLTFGRRQTLATRLAWALGIGSIAIVTAGAALLAVGPVGPVYGGNFLLDSLAVATRGGVLTLALLTLGVAAAAKLPRHPAEYVAIILFATTGFMLMSAAHHLLIAFVALELASLSLYVLAGFDQSRRESAEAGLKYFLFGGVATAFLLFGFSLIYGLTGQLDISRIAVALNLTGPSPLLVVAVVMVLVAFGFKAAAAPFHLWAPDTYEGAPTPSAALIASASKLAGFTLFLRLLWPGLGALAGEVATAGNSGGWLTGVALLSGASLLLGNLAAIAPTNLRRLLAYSAIAHTGAMLLGVMAAETAGAGGNGNAEGSAPGSAETGALAGDLGDALAHEGGIGGRAPDGGVVEQRVGLKGEVGADAPSGGELKAAHAGARRAVAQRGLAAHTAARGRGAGKIPAEAAHLHVRLVDEHIAEIFRSGVREEFRRYHRNGGTEIGELGL